MDISCLTSKFYSFHPVSGYGYYIYLEVSGARNNQSARLISASIPATTATNGKCLRFWYHMYGPHVNTLSVYVKVGSHTGAAIWKKTGTQGNQWNLGMVTVNSPYFLKVSSIVCILLRHQIPNQD